MFRQSLKWSLAVATLFAIATPSAYAQAPAPSPPPPPAAAETFTIPAGATSWKYVCKPGTQCPTRCAAGAAELFSTSDYASIIIVEFPNRSLWLRIDTGKNTIDYVGAAGSLLCSINGATLVSAESADKPTKLPLTK